LTAAFNFALSVVDKQKIPQTRTIRSLRTQEISCIGKKGEQKENGNSTFHPNANAKTLKQIQVMIGR